jgi:hypothetical protein
MKYLYGIFIGILSVVALVWVIRLGIEGKPVTKIKLSEFSTSKDVAVALTMRLRQEIKDHKIVFLGVDPEEPEHLSICLEILNTTDEPGWRFDEILMDKSLAKVKPLGVGEKIVDLRAQESELKNLWSQEAYKERRLAVIVPHVYSSQLLLDNPVQRLKPSPEDGRVLSVTIVPLGQKGDEPEINRLPCVAEGADFTGQSPLGCAIRKKAMFWSRPLKKGVRLGILEQFGLHDFVLFFRPIHP